MLDAPASRSRLFAAALPAAVLLAALALAPAACDGGGGGGSADPDAAAPADDAPGDDAPGPADDAPGPGDADAAADDAPGPEAARYLYAPLDGEPPTTFPDDLLTRDDPGTPTGLRLATAGADAPWLAALPPPHARLYEALADLDGFGTTAALVLRFDGPLGEVPSGVPASLESDALRLVALEGGVATRVPYEARVTADHTLLVTPLLPLAPATRHALVLTTTLRDAAGRPASPGPALASLLDGTATDPALARMAPRYAEVLAALGLAPGDVAAATAFTTQSVVEESLAVAADIRGRAFAWEAPPTCEPVEGIRRCEGTFSAGSYRVDGVYAGPTPAATYDLDVLMWLPAEAGAGPWPTAVFGHGLAHEKSVSKAMARLTVPHGLAVVAIDAVAHGDHPDAPDDPSFELFAFFAVDLAPLDIRPLVLRDNFRQSTWDKLQLLELLAQHPDLDGDGAADVDLDRLGILGESFGGVMAIEPLALSSRLRFAGLQLAGGRVTSIVEYARRFELFSTLMISEGGTPADVPRIFPLIQTAVERGDASNYGPHVLGARLPGAGTAAPDLLLQLVIDDDTIPDPSSGSLVRALGLPHVQPVAQPVPLAPPVGPAPVADNLVRGPGDVLTAGFFQYDRITRGPGQAPEKASHDYTPSSLEAELQLERFLEGWLAGEAPPIVDPYAILGTPPLAPP